MEKGHFHVVTRFRAFQAEIYNWVIGRWGRGRSYLKGSRNDAVQLWGRGTCKATDLNSADLHPIDFPEQTIFTLLIFLVH